MLKKIMFYLRWEPEFAQRSTLDYVEFRGGGEGGPDFDIAGNAKLASIRLWSRVRGFAPGNGEGVVPRPPFLWLLTVTDFARCVCERQL